VETISVHGLVDICLFYGEQHTGYQQTLWASCSPLSRQHETSASWVMRATSTTHGFVHISFPDHVIQNYARISCLVVHQT
jgi:hypothetical protein